MFVLIQHCAFCLRTRELRLYDNLRNDNPRLCFCFHGTLPPPLPLSPLSLFMYLHVSLSLSHTNVPPVLSSSRPPPQTQLFRLAAVAFTGPDSPLSVSS